MKILITGGAGFIGSRVADAYSAAGRSVTVSTEKRENVNPRTWFVTARDAFQGKK